MHSEICTQQFMFMEIYGSQRFLPDPTARPPRLGPALKPTRLAPAPPPPPRYLSIRRGFDSHILLSFSPWNHTPPARPFFFLAAFRAVSFYGGSASAAAAATSTEDEEVGTRRALPRGFGSRSSPAAAGTED